MGNSVLSIGITGLNAARLGLTTTGHNISNVSTPGFTRQTTIFTPASPQFTGAGYVGSGVEVINVVRQYSEFLSNQRLAAETQQGYLSAFLTQSRQIDNVLADPSSGLSPALQDFFSGVQDVASNPSSVPSRQSMLSLSEAMVSRVQSLDARFRDLREGVNAEIRAAVGNINSLATQLAQVNDRIASAASDGNQLPNDLLDQRGYLVSQLNAQVKVTAVAQSDGTLNVFIGSGQSLVVGGAVLGLDATASPDDPANLELALVTDNATIPLPSSIFQGGKLGGLLAFRDQTLDQAQNTFGRVVTTLAQTFNEQHRLGQDLNGALGTDYFRVPQPSVQARSTNLGDGVLTATIDDATQLSISDFRVTYAGGNWTVRRLPDGTENVYGSLPQTFDGITLDLPSGTPQDGDMFLVQPTRYAGRDVEVLITDPALVAAAAPVRTTAALTNNGNAKITQGVVTDVTDLPLPSPVTFTYDQAANEWAVSGASPAAGPFTYASGADITFNGLTFQISGTPADGDSFTLSNNTSGVADNRNALLLGRLQTTPTVAGGSANYQSAYSQMVSQVGNDTREIEVQSQAQEILVKTATDAEQAFSGVNLDEEAANLVRFQQAYQASAKVLQIATELFDQILQFGN